MRSRLPVCPAPPGETSSGEPAIATLVIPVLDQRPTWLDRSVRSALAQTVPTEVLVVCASRTPGARIAQLGRLAAANPRLQLLHEHTPGFAGALNIGIRAASAPRVGFLLSDDWLEPTAVEESAALDADIVSTGLEVYDADGRTRFRCLGRTPTQEELDRRGSIQRRAAYLEHFFLFRRTALLAAGGVDEHVGLVGADDYDLIWTLLEKGASVAVLPRRLYNYRDHGRARLSLRSRRDQLRDIARVLAKHGVTGRERFRLLREHAHWFGRPVHVAAAGRAGRRLGSDLLALVATRSSVLRDASILSPRGSAERGAFRLCFADGTVLKGRTLETPQQARTVALHVLRLPRRAFPRVIARRGRALLEEWVEGTPLGAVDPDEALALACGGLLGEVHRSRGAGELRPNGDMARLGAALERLVVEGAIDRTLAAAALHLAATAAPRSWEGGLVHGDFCGENLVLDTRGQPCMVDNETLDVDAYDYDLARTWYRWPMPTPIWESFLAGYAAHRDPGPFLRHFDFWAVRALVDGACFRLRMGTLDADVPSRRLTALVAGRS